MYKNKERVQPQSTLPSCKKIKIKVHHSISTILSVNDLKVLHVIPAASCSICTPLIQDSLPVLPCNERHARAIRWSAAKERDQKGVCIVQYLLDSQVPQPITRCIFVACSSPLSSTNTSSPSTVTVARKS